MSELRTLYFAHPVNVFSVPLEEEMMDLLAQVFPDWKIENPNQPHHQRGYAEWKKRLKDNPNKHGGMSYYYDEVLPYLQGCVSMPFLDGKFGQGVAQEAKFFIERKQPSFVIVNTIYEFFIVREMTEREKRFIAALDPSLMLGIEETRARTWTAPEKYNVEKLAYDQAHLIHFVHAEWTTEHIESLKQKGA